MKYNNVLSSDANEDFMHLKAHERANTRDLIKFIYDGNLSEPAKTLLSGCDD